MTNMGRLSVDRRFRGQGLGGTLLMNVFHRALLHSHQIVSIALIGGLPDLFATSLNYNFIEKRKSDKSFSGQRYN